MQEYERFSEEEQLRHEEEADKKKWQELAEMGGKVGPLGTKEQREVLDTIENEIQQTRNERQRLQDRFSEISKELKKNASRKDTAERIKHSITEWNVYPLWVDSNEDYAYFRTHYHEIVLLEELRQLKEKPIQEQKDLIAIFSRILDNLLEEYRNLWDEHTEVGKKISRLESEEIKLINEKSSLEVLIRAAQI